ncbi:MAG TPA: PhoPQ-activated protein PqaA family protein [Fimbriimonadaceae bacterium]|mgnify:CR=1 FL=1|nr:PhoPQ-activated protein PqaA family protein [Fimbriimonadaceae bacterium]HRJ97278.1 PhoPQ-activated protein PqaA family protein [Fimbriimonadaceae bacterium]
MISTLALLLVGRSSGPPRELQNYLRRPEPAYSWRRIENVQNLPKLKLVSQTWQGMRWEHEIIFASPARPVATGTAVLFVTGGKPGVDDLMLLKTVVDQAGLPTAVLFDIPNQPIWGMSEDDLIAHTFEKYLETGDPTWPLLFPMVKSTIKAMDAIVAFTKTSSNPIKNFVVTGASKRGWTTWLVGAAGDKRVKGIAPLVIDNLNVAAQMKHQIESWGKYSEQIEEYTKRGLQAKLDTAEGRKLAAMVDPYSYRSRVTMPTLIVNGANDRYWTVDALSLYWGDLKQPKYSIVVPNAGHDLGDLQWAIRGVTAFARASAGAMRMPALEAKIEAETARIVRVGAGFSTMRVWAAESESRDFRESQWSAIAEVKIDPPTSKPDASRPEVRFGSSRKNRALFVEAEFQSGGLRFSLTTPVVVQLAR